MAMVKLALSGLEGIEDSKVKLGRAWVVYDPEEVEPEKIVATITDGAGFPASLETDKPYDPAAEEAKEKCAWYKIGC